MNRERRGSRNLFSKLSRDFECRNSNRGREWTGRLRKFTENLPVFGFWQLKWNHFHLQTSTILALLGRNYRNAIPSKLFEYLSTGLPIIFSGTEDAAKLLRRFEHIRLESEDPRKLCQLILQIKTLPLTRSFSIFLKRKRAFYPRTN